MKTSSLRRALALANTFNLLVAIYFLIISVVSLIQLRWYHQLTVTLKVRHFVTLTASYAAFVIPIFVALVLIVIFAVSVLSMSPKVYVSPRAETCGVQTSRGADASTNNNNLGIPSTCTAAATAVTTKPKSSNPRMNTTSSSAPTTRTKHSASLSQHEWSTRERSAATARSLVVSDSSARSWSNYGTSCSILLHLVAAVSLVVIMVIWLLNTGELVRDALSSQLDLAFAKYQFANRSNSISVAIDGMQDVNNCCGSLDYTDFPHQRQSGLSGGHYPGSCCGKNIFGTNARVICTPEDIIRAKQTSGCVNVLANHYDLISLLLLPIALASLFVNITIIALIAITRGNILGAESGELTGRFKS